MTSSRQHAQQAARELWEKFSPVVTGGTEADRQATYERWVNERADVLERHIAAALAEQEALLYRAIRELNYIEQAEQVFLCQTSEGQAIVREGMELLGVKDLSADALPAPPAKGETK